MNTQWSAVLRRSQPSLRKGDCGNNPEPRWELNAAAYLCQRRGTRSRWWWRCCRLRAARGCPWSLWPRRSLWRRARGRWRWRAATRGCWPSPGSGRRRPALGTPGGSDSAEAGRARIRGSWGTPGWLWALYGRSDLSVRSAEGFPGVQEVDPFQLPHLHDLYSALGSRVRPAEEVLPRCRSGTAEAWGSSALCPVLPPPPPPPLLLLRRRLRSWSTSAARRGRCSSLCPSPDWWG